MHLQQFKPTLGETLFQIERDSCRAGRCFGEVGREAAATLVNARGVGVGQRVMRRLLGYVKRSSVWSRVALELSKRPDGGGKVSEGGWCCESFFWGRPGRGPKTTQYSHSTSQTYGFILTKMVKGATAAGLLCRHGSTCVCVMRKVCAAFTVAPPLVLFGILIRTDNKQIFHNTFSVDPLAIPTAAQKLTTSR